MSVFDLCEIRKDQVVCGLLGEFLGRGRSREVYASPIDENIVIKIAYNPQGIMDNADEWTLWCLSKDRELRNWLCPIIGVFGDGRVLYMKKVEHTSKDELRRFEEVPAIIEDVHTDNWGILDGRLVCFDYAVNSSTSIPKKLKMKKVVWE